MVSSADEYVGICEPDMEDFNAQQMRIQMGCARTYAVNTFYQIGPTYYGVHGERKRVDYFMLSL